MLFFFVAMEAGLCRNHRVASGRSWLEARHDVVPGTNSLVVSAHRLSHELSNPADIESRTRFDKPLEIGRQEPRWLPLNGDQHSGSKRLPGQLDARQEHIDSRVARPAEEHAFVKALRSCTSLIN
ncbi:MAG: hypothetical protein JNM69_06560 [Archangium sp.]|nr:hypothetical protein [Archangium sp.]